MIEIRGISKSFKKEQVLDNINLVIPQGEICVVKGASGCGKTTLLNIIAGFVKPDRGHVKLQSSRVSYAFQNDLLLNWKSAKSNLLFTLLSYFPKKESEELSKKWLEIVGLSDYSEQSVAKFSGGMRKRLNLVRSFSIQPDVLLLDEPFVSLDKDNIKIVVKLIKECVEKFKTTIVIVTHAEENLGGVKYRSFQIPVRDVNN